MLILISDVTRDEDWIPFLSFSESAGFGGVLSIPLLSRAGNLIGVTSCHFSGHAKPTKTEMNFVREAANSPAMRSSRSAAWPRYSSPPVLIKKAKFCDGDHIAFT